MAFLINSFFSVKSEGQSTIIFVSWTQYDDILKDHN